MRKQIGLDQDGYKVTLELDIQHKAKERLTTNLEPISDYDTLAISGFAQYQPHQDWHYGGQINDTIRRELDQYRKLYIPKEQILEILDIWDKWHLNDLKPGTVNMIEGNYDDPAIRNQIDRGYHYGTAWLVEPLPKEVKDRIIELFS